MSGNLFTVELDGRKVVVNQTTQEVNVLDDTGVVCFRDRIQVAAGSVQGIFSAVQDLTDHGPGMRPVTKA